LPNNGYVSRRSVAVVAAAAATFAISTNLLFLTTEIAGGGAGGHVLWVMCFRGQVEHLASLMVDVWNGPRGIGVRMNVCVLVDTFE
jgi:hypothetical protein